MRSPILWLVLTLLLLAAALITAFTVGWFAPIVLLALSVISAVVCGGLVLRRRS